MPAPYLNNEATPAAFTDAATVVFTRARGMFAAQISNNAVVYALASTSPNGRDPVWSSEEHYTVPALLTFDNPEGDGLPPGSYYAGIRIRSAAASAPARVTVS
jgi:hypothetical protein